MSRPSTPTTPLPLRSPTRASSSRTPARSSPSPGSRSSRASSSPPRRPVSGPTARYPSGGAAGSSSSGGRYGQPASSPEATAAFKALPFGTRFRLGFNGPAFFFGPIYYAIKGPWRKGLSLLGGVVVLSVIVGIIEFALGITIPSGAFGAAVGVIYSTTANWAYFLHVTRGSTSWNPFEGMPMVRKKA